MYKKPNYQNKNVSGYRNNRYNNPGGNMNAAPRVFIVMKQVRVDDHSKMIPLAATYDGMTAEVAAQTLNNLYAEFKNEYRFRVVSVLRKDNPTGLINCIQQRLSKYDERHTDDVVEAAHDTAVAEEIKSDEVESVAASMGMADGFIGELSDLMRKYEAVIDAEINEKWDRVDTTISWIENKEKKSMEVGSYIDCDTLLD